jgi:MarR family transcriptional regulator, organic hydroperoxide resistance regulator
VTGKLATDIKQTKPLSLESEAVLNIQRTADHLSAAIGRVLKAADLSASQFNVLRILRGAGKDGLACGEIGERMVARDPDITRLLDRLEKRGVIERSRDGRDRRVVTTRITDAGLKILKELDRPVEQEIKRHLGRVGRERLTDLIEALDMIREPV